MNDREHATDFYYFYSYLLSLFPISRFFFFFFKKSGVQFIENLQDGWEMRFRIVLHITIFSKIVSFSEKITKKNFWDKGGASKLAFLCKNSR